MRAALLFACLISAPALAANSGTAQDVDGTTEAAKPAAKEKKICRKDEQTSSRVRKQICRTATEWETADQNKTTAGDLRRIGN